MKQALAAAILVLAVAIGFILWIAAGMGPHAEFVPYVEPPPPSEKSYLQAAYNPLHFRPAIETADDAQAAEVARLAERLLRDCRKVEVLDGGVGDLGRFEDLGQGLEPLVRNLGDTDARLLAAHAGGFMHARQDREQRRFAHHRQADNCCFHGKG